METPGYPDDGIILPVAWGDRTTDVKLGMTDVQAIEEDYRKSLVKELAPVFRVSRDEYNYRIVFHVCWLPTPKKYMGSWDDNECARYLTNTDIRTALWKLVNWKGKRQCVPGLKVTTIPTPGHPDEHDFKIKLIEPNAIVDDVVRTWSNKILHIQRTGMAHVLKEANTFPVCTNIPFKQIHPTLMQQMYEMRYYLCEYHEELAIPSLCLGRSVNFSLIVGERGRAFETLITMQ